MAACMTSFTIYYSCFLFVMMYDETIVSIVYSSLLFKISDHLRAVFGLIVISFSIIHTLITKSFYGNILNLYCKIDNLFHVLGIQKNYTDLRTKIIVVSSVYYIVSFSYVTLSLILISAWNKRSSYPMNIVMYGPSFVITMILVFFNTNVKIVTNNLALLNKQLNIMDENHYKRSFVYNKIYKISALFHFENIEITKNRLQTIMKIYDTICQSADKINKQFTKILLIIMAISFVSVVFNMFYVFMTMAWIFQSNNTNKLLTFLLFSLHQCILNSTNVGLAITACQSCEAEVILK